MKRVDNDDITCEETLHLEQQFNLFISHLKLSGSHPVLCRLKLQNIKLSHQIRLFLIIFTLIF